MIDSIRIIVVNWNLREDTLACIRSLIAAGVAAEQVILVDNGSTDGSVPALRAAFDDALVLVETGENLGLSGGVNVGLAKALKSDAEWILLLNNDTVVLPDIFTEFGKAAAALPDISIWGPQIHFHADPNRIWFFGERKVFGTLLGRPVLPSDRFDPALQDPVEVDFISGCAMLVRRGVFERIGGFDPLYFLFSEEVDFCLRAARAGFRLAAAPGARLMHKVSLSTDRDKPGARFHRIRNQAWVYRRYGGFGQRMFLRAFTLLRASGILIGDLVHGRIELIRPLISGWLAGWFGSLAGFADADARLKPWD